MHWAFMQQSSQFRQDGHRDMGLLSRSYVACRSWGHGGIALVNLFYGRHGRTERECGPEEFFLRFDMTGYPASAPTAMPWNPAIGGKLEKESRPQGVRVAHIFRTDWEDGDALYAPFDRRAVARHPDWPQRYPHAAWNTSQGLTPVLNYLHKLLNDEDYTGIQAN